MQISHLNIKIEVSVAIKGILKHLICRMWRMRFVTLSVSPPHSYDIYSFLLLLHLPTLLLMSRPRVSGADWSMELPSWMNHSPSWLFKLATVETKNKMVTLHVNVSWYFIVYLQSSGVKVADECKTHFEEIKKGKKHRYVVFYIKDEKSIVVEAVGGRDASYDDYLRDLQSGGESECRQSLIYWWL